MNRTLLLGIDIGTSACKVCVFDTAGNVIASASESYPVSYPRPGWAEQNPDDWWQAVCHALNDTWARETLRPSEIAAIGVDGLSWAAVPVGKDSTCLCNTPLWMDTRASSICERINRETGDDRFFACSGNAFVATYTTPKVLWYREQLPDVFARTEKILQSNGYIVFRLTGAFTQDICQGYGWHCFDMHTGRWDYSLASELGIPASFLPEIVPCDHVAGYVNREAAAQTGLPEGIPVVAGGLDAACATLGAGVIRPGETQEQGGQAGGMSICLDTYCADKRLILSFHVIPDLWLLQGGTTGGGGVMRWFEKEFAEYERARAAETGLSSFDALNKLAAEIPAGSEGVVFLPYMAGERTPIWDAGAKGVFYGLDFSKRKAHLVRACMEGVALSLRHNLETAREAGAEATLLRAVGGSANSLLWTQIKADVCGLPVTVPASDTATTLGAALLAGKGAGIYASYEEAVKMTVRDTRHHAPDPEKKPLYDTLFERYTGLYDALKTYMHA